MAGIELAAAYVQLIPSFKGIDSEIAKAFGPITKQAEKAGDESGDGFASKFTGKLGAMAVAGAGIAVAGAFGGAFSEALDVDAGRKKMQAQLNLSADESAKIGSLAGNLYSTNYGDNLAGVNDAITSVMQNVGGMKDASMDDLGEITAETMSLSSAMGQDLAGTTAAVGQLMKTGLAKNAQEALDIIAAGFQKGVDKKGDYLDTLNEYGSQFTKLGIDGKTATGLLSQGLEGGARDADLVADAFKEFSIRAIDGSKSTAAAYAGLGLDATDMTNRIAAGGTSASAATEEVLQKLGGVADPATKAAIATGLFGTQSEDLGQALYGLDLTSAAEGMGDIAGRASDVDAAMGSTAEGGMIVFWRTLKTNVVNFIIDDVLPVFNDIATWLNEKVVPAFQLASQWIRDHVVPAIQTMAAWIKDTLLPAVGEIVQWLIDKLSPAFATVATFIEEKIVPAIQSMVGWISDNFVPALQAAGDWVQRNREWLEPLGVAILAGAAALGVITVATKAWGIAVGIVSKVTKIWSAIQAAFNFIMNMNPISLVIIAIAALVAGIIYAYKNSETFRDIVDQVWTKIKSVIDVVWGFIQPIFAAIGDQLTKTGGVFDWLYTSVIEPVFGYIKETFDNFLAVVQGVWDIIAGIFTGDWARVWDGVKGIFTAVWDQILNFLGTIGTILGGVGGKLLEWGGQLMGWIWDGIKAGASAVWDWFKNLPDALWGTIQDSWSKAGEWGRKFLGWIWDGIKTGAAAVLQYFMDLPANFWTGLQVIWATVSTWGTSFLNYIWTGSADGTGTGGMKGGAAAVLQYFMDLPGNFWTGLQVIWATVAGWGVSLMNFIWSGSADGTGTGGIVGVAASVLQYFMDLPANFWSGLQTIWATVSGWGVAFFNFIWSGSADGTGVGGIKGVVAAVLQYFMDLPANFWNGLQNIWATVSNWGVSFVNFIWSGSADGTGTGGIKGVAASVLQYFMDLPANFWSGLQNIWATVSEWGVSMMTWIWEGSDGKGGIKGGVVALWNWFSGGIDNPDSLLGGIWAAVQTLAGKMADLGMDLVRWIVGGIASVASEIWTAITDALTGTNPATPNGTAGSTTNNQGNTGNTPGYNPGGGARGAVVPGGARGNIVPGRDPGRRDNVLAQLPNGQPFGLRSEEAIMVPEFTHGIGGVRGVNALNRLAEQGRLGDLALGINGFAEGGVVAAKQKLQDSAAKVGADAAWARANELIEENKNHPLSAGGAYPAAAGTRGAFMAAVASQMGLEYVWGGASPPNFDCSGLMSWALAEAGHSIGRLTAANFGDQFPRISPEKPGDMAIFDTGRVSPKAGHIGMVLDPAAGTMMHTDGAGPSRVSDYRSRSGLMGFIDPIGGEYQPLSTAGTGAAWLTDILGKAREKLGIRLNNAVGTSFDGVLGAGNAGINTVDPIQDFGAMNMSRGDISMAGVLPPGGAEDRWSPLYTKVLTDKGLFSATRLQQMMYQMHTESGGDPMAYNDWDSNFTGGHPSKGLLQTIPGTFRSNADSGFSTNIWDPESNARAAVNYVNGKYSGVFPGVAYDSGGWLMPGGSGINMTATPEPILTPSQWDTAAAAIANVSRASNAGGVRLIIEGHGDLADFVREHARVEIIDALETEAFDLQLAGGRG